MQKMPMIDRSLAFVVCASDAEQLQRRLLVSECLQSRRYRLAVYFDSPSAARAFNEEMDHSTGEDWLVWVHQDVFLPDGWDRQFLTALAQADSVIPRLAVVGVYGIDLQGRRAGHVLDRGRLLREPQPLPCEASSLDEVLVAVRTSSRLVLDSELRYHFYATDLVLAARQRGWAAAVVDSCCEHWSDTPTSGSVARTFAEALIADARVFETKWLEHLPLATPCFNIRQPGDVERFVQAHFPVTTDATQAAPPRPNEAGVFPSQADRKPFIRSRPLFEVLLFDGGTLRLSEEFALGQRELRRRIRADRWWHAGPSHRPILPAHFLQFCQADRVLVILDPAVLVADNLIDELLDLTPGGQVACALPADLRTTGTVTVDYASRPGFDRHVARRARLPAAAPYAGQSPWLYMMTLEALRQVVADDSVINWERLPESLGSRTLLAQRTFIHSWSNYQQNTRAEMLDLLPARTSSLLDVGGGEGGFAAAFVERFGGQATVAELNPAAGERAKARGLTVHCGPFEQLPHITSFDCIAFLDVLEHLADPLAALRKAHSLLKPGGHVLLAVPNVGHWSVVQDLLQGEFDYQPVGILCVGHLRFFTRRGLEKLIEDAGFQVARWRDCPSPLPGNFQAFLDQAAAFQQTVDFQSLATDSFHALIKAR